MRGTRPARIARSADAAAAVKPPAFGVLDRPRTEASAGRAYLGLLARGARGPGGRRRPAFEPPAGDEKTPEAPAVIALAREVLLPEPLHVVRQENALGAHARRCQQVLRERAETPRAPRLGRRRRSAMRRGPQRPRQEVRHRRAEQRLPIAHAPPARGGRAGRGPRPATVGAGRPQPPPHAR